MGKLWENIWFRFAVIAGLIALILWASYELRQILVSLTLAFIVAYIFHPVVDYLENRKIPRTVSIAGILLAILAGVAATLLVVVPRLVQETQALVRSVNEKFPIIKEKGENLFLRFSGSRFAERIMEGMQGLLDQLESYLPKALQSLDDVLIGFVSGTFGVVGFIANFLLFAVVAVYLLKDFNRILAGAEELIPPARRDYILKILGRIDQNLRSFFRGQMVVCTILAAFYFIGLLIVGVPFSLLIALVGGYGQVVPYLGTALAILPAVLLALIEFADLIHPVATLLVFVIGQTLEGTVITPRIVGESIGLHPVVVILAILVFAKLMGFLGILLAVPITAALKVLAGEAIARYKQSNLFAPESNDDSSSS